MNSIQMIENEMVPLKRTVDFKVGDTVKVHFRIIEGNKERVQVYEGIVIAIDGKGVSKTFTVRKISFDIGVERVFPLHTPKITKIEVVRKGKIRRAKLYYLRDRKGKGAKVKEKIKKTGLAAAVAPEKKAETAE